MHDFIVVVNNGTEDSLLKWHRKLLIKYSNHYSKISKFFGVPFIVGLQKYSKYYPIYYNSCIPSVNNKILKYGVITKKDLLSSLENWSSLFVSQRFQKTICPILNGFVGKLDIEIKDKLEKNRKKALVLSLLSLSENKNINDSINKLNHNGKNDVKIITLYDLLKEIVTSTYKGDIRFMSKMRRKILIQTCEKELYNSLPFLVSYYLPLMLEYMKENNSVISIHNKNDNMNINNIVALSELLRRKLETCVNNDPLSGMNDDIVNSFQWRLFYRLFIDNKIEFSFKPNLEWKINEFEKLPFEFKNTANKIFSKMMFIEFIKKSVAPLQLSKNCNKEFEIEF
ncbi:hypothetical protein FG386_002476 [Cryptosporidium ryanae]|uniref:uncharacterized protein n=1 Tax=Cryptosporidium ryanae TaxID=515981 RepID=UPI00351A56DF|nr:hypothetical protein FG386_002476 [Cryptosporidium ryanae]